MAKFIVEDKLWELVEPLLPVPKPRRFASGPQALGEPGGVDGHPVYSQDRPALERSAARDGLRRWGGVLHDLRHDKKARVDAVSHTRASSISPSRSLSSERESSTFPTLTGAISSTLRSSGNVFGTRAAWLLNLTVRESKSFYCFGESRLSTGTSISRSVLIGGKW